MQSEAVRTLTLVIVLGSVGTTVAQSPPGQQSAGQPQQGGLPPGSPKQKATPEKSKLEEMLVEALRNNPDIRVASAKLAEADAELNRTRLQVTQKVVLLYHAIESQKKVVEHAEKKYKRGHQPGGAISAEESDELRQTLALAKAKLAELEAQIPALLGKERSSATEEAVRHGALEPVQSKMLHFALNARNFDVPLAAPERMFAVLAKLNVPQAEKLRKAMQTPIKADYKDMTFDDILKGLSNKVEGLSFRNLFERGAASNRKMSFRFEETLPLSALLQALADETGCSFYVRDYGILAIRRESAPPGAMTVEEFLRQKPAEDRAKNVNADQWSGLPWKPPENIEGTIKKTISDGSVVISFNSVDGLLQGHTLHVYRPSNEQSKAKYLGTVQIFGFSPSQQQNEMIGRPIGRFSEPPKVGDKVTARAPAK